ncbi:MAG TPA: pseudouridine synthase, partial [Leptospiraceae bacterium]|nr:pseudouridine synthase [Leptospiraceae bacterium]
RKNFDRGERKNFDRGERKNFDRGERKNFDRGERKNFDRGERKNFDRGERKNFDRGERKNFDRGERKNFDRGERKNFDRDERKNFDRDDRENFERNEYYADEEYDAPVIPKKRKGVKAVIKSEAVEKFDEQERAKKLSLLGQLKTDEDSYFLKDFRNEGTSYEQKGEFRINRFLSRAGLGSRRDVEVLIQEGKVSMNGEPVSSFSVKVNPEKDRVEVEGQEVKMFTKKIVLAFNKPAGYLSSHHDEHHEKNMFHLLPYQFRRLHMSGRLDLTSRGLMILSNEGGLTQRISHPSMGLSKVYELSVQDCPDEKILTDSFLKGIDDKGEMLRAKEVEVLERTEDSARVRIELKEGKKRQLHRMFEALGARVTDLQRIKIGRLDLKTLDLEEGQFKEVGEDEIFGEEI